MHFPSESVHKDYKIYYFAEIDSTNKYAWKYTSNNNPNEKVVVIAGNQTAGKGQYGRNWRTEPGKNITMSVILAQGNLHLKEAFYLNIIVSVSIMRAIQKHLGIYLNVKWPNDIYHSDQKLGGILIKNRVIKSCIESSVIGMGLNVNQDEFHSSLPNPVSLKQILQKEISLKKLILSLLDELSSSFEIYNTLGIKSLHYYYLDHLYAKDIFRYYRFRNERKKLAIIDVDQRGDLLLKDDNGVLHRTNSELEYVLK